jgi:GTP-binding protein HflX
MFDSNADILNKKDKFTAVLVGVINQKQSEVQALEYLDELAFLARTAGVDSLKYYTQSLEKPNPKTFVGTGKLDEIATYVKANKIDFIIFDDELSPSH